jgi:hypothetical protein
VDESSLEEKHARMLKSMNGLRAKMESYSTPEGTVCKFPDFSDPAVFDEHMNAMLDAHEYFKSATHLRHATTYRYQDSENSKNRILHERPKDVSQGDA